MAERIAVRPTHITYLPVPSVERPKDTEDETLAQLWGCKPSSAHQRKLRVADEAADVIRVKRLAGATESLALWLRPIEEALECRTPVTNPHLAASHADAAEDYAEADFIANPCEQTARVLLRKRAAERQTSWDADRDIAAKYGIRL